MTLFVLLITACSNTIEIDGFQGIPESTFYGIEPVYATGDNIGNLTQSYITNTESLINVNNRLEVLCKARELENCGPR